MSNGTTSCPRPEEAIEQKSRHPHYSWCADHADAGDDLLVHTSDGEIIGLTASGSDGIKLQLERTTHPSGEHHQHQAEPRVFIASMLDGVCVGGETLSLHEARELRAALGDMIRLAETPQIPVGTRAFGHGDECPEWCIYRTSLPDDISHPRWHIGRSFGPREWFVRRTRPHVDDVAHIDPYSDPAPIELAYCDDTPIDLDAPAARSLAAALVRVADEVEL